MAPEQQKTCEIKATDPDSAYVIHIPLKGRSVHIYVYYTISTYRKLISSEHGPPFTMEVDPEFEFNQFLDIKFNKGCVTFLLFAV